MVPQAIKKLPLLGRLVEFGIHSEEWFYDAWHNVNTSTSDREFPRTTINFPFQPTRPGRMRAILQELPIDYSQFVFVDIGSGKGRTLLVAAEFPFRLVEGIELQKDLHDQAVKNIADRRRMKLRAARVESKCMNATQYKFPDLPTVVYMFNPFGQEIMEGIIAKLAESLRQHPRDVFVAMFNPEFAFVVEAVPALKLYKEAAGAKIYRSRAA